VTVHEGETRPHGSLGLIVTRGEISSAAIAAGLPPSPLEPDPRLTEIVRHGLPQLGLREDVNRWRRANLANLKRGLRRVLPARALGIPTLYGSLYLRKITGEGEVIELGLASLQVVTDNGMGFVVDAFENLVEPENMKFHGFGVGTNAENATDSALQTEETTQYNPDNTRPTGTLAEASQKVFQTVATYSPDSGTSPRPITEHGVFSQAATGGGVLLDRSVFSVVSLATSADSLQATYQLTFNSGG
jgi:hypothetical protein